MPVLVRGRRAGRNIARSLAVISTGTNSAIKSNSRSCMTTYLGDDKMNEANTIDKKIDYPENEYFYQQMIWPLLFPYRETIRKLQDRSQLRYEIILNQNKRIHKSINNMNIRNMDMFHSIIETSISDTRELLQISSLNELTRLQAKILRRRCKEFVDIVHAVADEIHESCFDAADIVLSGADIPNTNLSAPLQGDGAPVRTSAPKSAEPAPDRPGTDSQK